MRRHEPLAASAIADLVGGALHGPDREVRAVAPVETAGPDCAAFVEGAPRADRAGAAGVLICRAPLPGRTCVVVEDPRRAFAALLRRLFPEEHRPGVHPGAHVDPTARLGPGVVVHPGAWIGADCEVGAGTVIFPHVVLYPRTVVGRRCRIHAGAVLGADGFSYHPGPEGPEKMPQVGRVVVEDDVEIGANTCIDRAFLGETRIGRGSRLDNLVQVGHNSRLGRGVLVAGQAGLSGSVTLDDGVVLGGQVGIADHVRIGAGARLGARTGVHRDLEGGRDYLGAPAMPLREARRVWAALRRLPEVLRRLRVLERGGGRG